MANIAFALSPDAKTFPFRIPPGDQQQFTAIPRARISFFITDAVITAKIALNTSSIVSTLTLPVGYAYTFEYCTATIDTDADTAEADNFDDIGQLIYFAGDGSGARTTAMISQGISGILLNAGSSKTWTPVNAYQSPLFNQDNTAVAAIVAINDNNAGATAVSNFSLQASFLQFDLNQVFDYPLNFPIPVDSR